jgi:uncharacterized membrane protein YqaE (UPF0057 family)
VNPLGAALILSLTLPILGIGAYVFTVTRRNKPAMVCEAHQAGLFERSRDMVLVKILLAILLPPAAAALQVGISTHFWINLALTLLGGVPGMIHALWLVLTGQRG